MDLTHISNVRFETIQIDKEIYSGLGKRIHTAIMIAGSIDMIHPNGVRAQLLHERRIQLALLRVREGIIFSELIRHPCAAETESVQ